MTVQLSVLMLGAATNRSGCAADVSKVCAASIFRVKVSVRCSYWPATGPKNSFPLSSFPMVLRDHRPAVLAPLPPCSLQPCRWSLHDPPKHGNTTYLHVVLMQNNRTSVKEESCVLNLFFH